MATFYAPARRLKNRSDRISHLEQGGDMAFKQQALDTLAYRAKLLKSNLDSLDEVIRADGISSISSIIESLPIVIGQLNSLKDACNDIDSML